MPKGPGKYRHLLPRLGSSRVEVGPDITLVTPPGSSTQVDQISEDAWLVQRAPLNKSVDVQQVDPRTWVLQRSGRRRRSVKKLGPRSLHTHLLVDRRAARANMRDHQMSVGKYLAAEHIAWILRELDINCVLDIGGNVGEYGRLLRSGGFTGRIVSFEPVSRTADRLRDAAKDDSDWHIIECALGETEEKAEMTVVGGRGATSSLLDVSDFGKAWSPRLQGVAKQMVDVRRLDSVFDSAVSGIDAPRVFMKMDTQGYDLPVFRGAGERLDDVLGLQSEVASVPLYEGMARLPEQIAAYEKAGFETTGIFPVTRDRKTLRVIEFDVVMIRVRGLGQPEPGAPPLACTAQPGDN
jgi:FkbM family methyltransferase